MKYYLIPVFILIICVVSFLLFGCKKKSTVDIKDLERIVDEYCKYISDGDYKTAYEKYLNSSYKKDISLSDFTSAHEKRKEKVGILQEKKLTFNTNTYNIFSGLREYQFTYELKYSNTTNHEIIKLNDQDGIFLIEGTYTSSSSDTLRFMVW
ncbi:MAG TPA: hypothetical protein PK771_00720 [Spirochaetota bacterium]|nr:hypothetical protein [Spirochaetota bacterium]